MNRHERRKLARHATTKDEIFPGRHGPMQPEIADVMVRVMDALKEGFPNHDITLFISERDVPEGEDRLPRFNYASTGEREDMLAVLEAFVAKHREEGAALDKIAETPPTETRQ